MGAAMIKKWRLIIRYGDEKTHDFEFGGSWNCDIVQAAQEAADYIRYHIHESERAKITEWRVLDW